MRIPHDCFANFVAELSHDTGASVAYIRIFMCRKLVSKVLNMFKKIMQIFSPKVFVNPWQDCCTSVV